MTQNPQVWMILDDWWGSSEVFTSIRVVMLTYESEVFFHLVLRRIGPSADCNVSHDLRWFVCKHSFTDLKEIVSSFYFLSVMCKGICHTWRVVQMFSFSRCFVLCVGCLDVVSARTNWTSTSCLRCKQSENLKIVLKQLVCFFLRLGSVHPV